MWILTMGLHATNAVCITTVEYTTKEKAEAAGALWFSIRGEEEQNKYTYYTVTEK